MCYSDKLMIIEFSEKSNFMPHPEYFPFHKFEPVKDVKVDGEPSILQEQVGVMEDEVKKIQMELAAIRQERFFLSRKTADGVESQETQESYAITTDSLKQDEIECVRNPQVSQLREDLIRAKNLADEERFQREKYEKKLKGLEQKLNSICREEIPEVREVRKPTEEVNALKKELREVKEENEELKMSLNEKSDEAQDYRLKYLQAQQQAEELKRQVDVMEFDNKQVSDQIQMEIQTMKMQFQEKLQELAPLPDLLKGAQIQLQEAKQLQKLAESSSEQLSNELQCVKEKLVIAVNNLSMEKVDNSKLIDENKALRIELEQKMKEVDDLLRNVDEYKYSILRLEEKLLQEETRYKEKSMEFSQILNDLEDVKTESSRSLARSKERCDSMRRYMQTQISELERQLIQSRAQCRACQKERDDIRQRIQTQVNNLQENFNLVRIKFRSMQNEVASLKNTYAFILSDEDNCNLSKVITT